jgi:hypothetical protein
MRQITDDSDANSERINTIYTDRMNVYRLTAYRNDAGEHPYGTYVIQNLPCKHYTTSNFDFETAVAAAMAGKNNIMTADYLHCPLIYNGSPIELKSGDYVKTTNSIGTEMWFTITGFGLERTRLNVAVVYILTTPAPVINFPP